MMKSRPHIIEATWSGYHSGQSRVCHRVKTTRRLESWEKISAVQFTDGTYMKLTMRQAQPRERIIEIHGYDQLFDQIIAQGLFGWINVRDVKDI